MKYLIVIAVILTASFTMGFVFGAVASDVSPEEQEWEDRDQIEFINRWREDGRRS